MRPGDGEWLPVLRIGDFEIYLVRFICGHGQLLRLHGDTPGNRVVLELARTQWHEEKEFICTRCAYDGEAPGVYTRIISIRRLR